jgi:hypothetical protein
MNLVARTLAPAALGGLGHGTAGVLLYTIDFYTTNAVD